MKQYKNPNELLENLLSKGVIISDKERALDKIKKLKSDVEFASGGTGTFDNPYVCL